jgi:hypothetical protein
MKENLKAEKESWRMSSDRYVNCKPSAIASVLGLPVRFSTLEQQKALVETKLADKEKKLDELTSCLTLSAR